MRNKDQIKKLFSMILAGAVISGGLATPGEITSLAATYVLQVDSTIASAKSLGSLPSSPNFVETGQSIQTPKAVNWVVDSGNFRDAGSQVTARYTILENGQTGTVPVTAIPDQVVYLVECNRTLDMAADYNRLQQNGDYSELRNEVPDQPYEQGGWGYLDQGLIPKGPVASMADSKGYTGYYSTDEIVYKLPLEAGTYSICAPIYEWWGNYQRSVDVVVEYEDSEEPASTTLGTAQLGDRGDCIWIEGSVTLDSEQTVSLIFKKTEGTGENAIAAGFTVIKTDSELPPSEDLIDIILDGNQVDLANTFGGFGAVTCNNTSRLLMDYKQDHPQQYWEIMKLLFDRQEGAGLHHIKIEMGADINSSSGTEPATMRSYDEQPDVRRGAGFHFAADAKTINPDITVELLRWGEPKWTQEGLGYESYPNPKYEARYQWYRKTIDAVYETYGYKIDEVSPGQNERRREYDDNFAWIKYCAERFNEDGEQGVGAYDYREIQIVAADLYRGMNTTVSYLDNDPQLKELVDVISDHYAINLGSEDLTRLNQQEGIRVIYGEAIAPMINADYRYHVEPEKGGVAGTTSMADLAERFIAAYAYRSATGHPARMTSFLYQPAIGAFYEGSAYSPKQLIGAFDPWSGYYEADGGIQMTKQFMLFADHDWQYLPEASYADGSIGDGGMNYNTSTDVRLAVKDPETDDYSVFFANNTTTERQYRIRLENLATDGAAYNIWETAGPGEGQAYDSGWFQKTVEGAVPEVDHNGFRSITLTVKPHSIVTLTTLTDRGESYQPGGNLAVDESGSRLERTVLALPYRDDFNYSDEFVEERGGTPKYTTDLEGAFEVVEAQDAPGYFVQQQINNENRPYNWNPWGSGSDESSQTTGTPWTVLGDHRWANYIAGIDFKLDLSTNGYGDNFAVLGVRELVHSNGAAYRGRIYADGSWQILKYNTVQASARVTDFDPAVWHKLQLEARENTITMYLDGQELGRYTDTGAGAVMTGRVTLMSGFWKTGFDNLEVMPIEGYSSAALVKADDTSPLLQFDGNVSHTVGEGFDHYNRTRTTMNPGSTLEFDLPAGQGFDLFGNSGAASLKIEQDQTVLTPNSQTEAAGNRETTYWNQQSLGPGRIKVTVLNGTYRVDGVNLFEIAESEPCDLELRHLDEMIGYAEGLTYDEEEFPPALVAHLRAVTEQARTVRGMATTQLELDLAALAIRNAIAGIVPGDTIIGIIDEIGDLVVTAGEQPLLPEQVRVVNALGVEFETPVSWEIDQLQIEQPWATVAVNGTVTGMDAMIAVRIQVIPAGLTHFVDSGTINASNEQGESAHSAVYDLIAAAVPLENDRSDRIYTEGSWGYINENITIKSNDSVNYQTDLYTSGLYSGAGRDIIYKIPLRAGRYTLMTGYQAYWNEQRTMDVSVSYVNSEGVEQTVELGSVTVNAGNSDIYHEGGFELTEDCLVAVHAGKNQASRDPVLSWLAIVDQAAAAWQQVHVNEPLSLIIEKGGDELPTELNISYQGEISDQPVEWSLVSGDLNDVGSAVVFLGMFPELPGKRITWSPVVYSKDLVYFIDAAVMTADQSPAASAVYEEIAEVAALRNEVPDQPLADQLWGYSGIDGSKSYEPGYGMHATGFYGTNRNGDSFTYQIVLDRGDYQIYTGHTEWWTQNRGTKVTASYVSEDGSLVTAELGQAVWNTGARWTTKTVQGGLAIQADDTVVTLAFTAVEYNQGAVVSYLAVEQIPEVAMTGIRVERLPNKRVYQIGESLDPAGMVVVATRSNAEPVELSPDQYQISDLDSATAGQKEITVSAVSEQGEEFTDHFFVTVSSWEYFTTKIRVTANPAKTVYDIDEPFDKTGMVVKAVKRATQSNASPIEEIIEDYEVEYDFSTPGTKRVGIFYEASGADGENREFTAYVNVTVRQHPRPAAYTRAIAVTSLPEKRVYRIGERFDPSGMEVTSYQIDRETAAESASLITDYQVGAGIFLLPGRQQVRVTYSAVAESGMVEVFSDSFEVIVIAAGSGSSGSSSSGSGSMKTVKSKTLVSGSWRQDQYGWWFAKTEGGWLQSEWAEIQGHWYYFNQSGYLVQSAWVQSQGNWYYLGADGAMYTNQWLNYQGEWYYLKADGSMARDSQTPDGYFVDEAGCWIRTE